MFATQKGFRFTFLGYSNDGVLCDSEFVLSVLTNFLKVKRKFTAHTNTNHNTNSLRYLLVIGGKNAKNIGIYLIDSGLLKKAEILHDLFRPEDLQETTLSSILHQLILYLIFLPLIAHTHIHK